MDGWTDGWLIGISSDGGICLDIHSFTVGAWLVGLLDDGLSGWLVSWLPFPLGFWFR
jgi:hypothetical protein